MIRDDDNVVYGDSGYTGIEKRPEIAGDSQKSQIEYIINRRPSSMKTKVPYNGINWEKEINIVSLQPVVKWNILS